MASTVVDAFLVTLGLDGTQFRRGMTEAEKQRRRLDETTTRGNRDRENQERILSGNQQRRQRLADAGTRSTIEGYRKIRNELLGLAAIFTAGVGIKDFISDTIKEAVSLGYLSDNLSMTTQKLTAYQRASERMGGTAGGMIAQLKESQDTLARFRSGLGPNEGLQAFFRWGGNPEDLKDGNSYLMARSRIIHEMFKVDPAKAALMAKQMGISDDQFDPMKQGPAAFEAMAKAQEKNAVITKKDTEAAKKLHEQMLNLRDGLKATGTQIVLALAPALKILFAELSKIADKVAKWVGENKENIPKWIAAAVEAIEKFLVKADELATAVGGWQNVLGGIVAAPIVLALGSIAAAVAGIVAAGAGIPALVAGIAAVAYFGGNKVKDEIERGREVVKPEDASEALWSVYGGPLFAMFGSKSKKPELDAFLPMSPKPSGTSIGGSRGIRNNNPGNIEYGSFTKARGATGSDGRFAQFSTPQAGIGAMADLLRSYGSRGINTVGGIVSRYAPGHENNTAAYIESVSKKLGVSGTATLDMNDPAVMEKLVSAMIQHENGKNPYSNDMLKRATMSQSQRQANAAAVGGMPAGAAASAAGGKAAGATVTNNSRFDAINVYTQATDAEGIAKAMRPALEKNSVAAQANTGFQ